jgi:DNA-binding transcriptional regulator PaaX
MNKNLSELIFSSVAENNLNAYNDLIELYQEEGYTKKEIRAALKELMFSGKIAYDDISNCFDIIIG